MTFVTRGATGTKNTYGNGASGASLFVPSQGSYQL